MKEYKIVINNQEFIIKQDVDGKFIKPDFIKEYEKIGSALKPSFEPIIVARKPFKGSLVDNVIEYGVGGINVDECRVGNEELHNSYMGKRSEVFSQDRTDTEAGMFTGDKKGETIVNGRFPANTILTYDETDFDEVCGGFPNTKQNGSIKNPNLKNSLGKNIYHKYSENQPLWESYKDSGSASRYFYCAKASKKDRDEGLNVEIEEYVLKENTNENIKNNIKRLLNL